MRTKPLHALSLAIGVFSTSVLANGGHCTSETFVNAFLEGQGIVEDFATVSSELTALGDQAVPCLAAIAENGEGIFDISCKLYEVDGGCRTWAIIALGSIATPKAQRALSGFLSTPGDPLLLSEAVRQLGRFSDASARPTLLKLLHHSSPEVRLAAVSSLARIRNPADIDALLDATLSLPDKQLYPAAVAVSTLRDPRLVELLDERARSIVDPTTRLVMERLVESMRARPAGN